MAIAYLRVSTEQQADSGAGLAAQRDACERVAGTLAAVYQDEGISGKTGLDARPALLEAIGRLKRGDVLIVAKRDRLGRDPLVVAMIESAVQRKGARIQSAAGEGTDGDSPADVLMRRMVDAFAEYERLVIGARTKSAMQAKKRRGERIGSVPYGYQMRGDVMVEHEREQEIVRLVRLLRESGMSLRKIADELSRRGYLSRTGGVFHPQTIGNIANG